MLKRFSVENFKGFSSKLTFDLTAGKYDFNTQLVKNGLVNKGLIYGPNGSGKTNLGIAIMDIARHLSDNQQLDNNYIGNFKNLDHTNSDVVFEYVFQFDDFEVEYSYKKNNLDSLVEEKMKVNGRDYLSYNYKDGKGVAYPEATMPPNTALPDNRLSIVKYIYRNTLSTENIPLRKMVDFVQNMLWFRCLSEGNAYAGFTVGIDQLAEQFYRGDSLKDFQDFLKEFGLDYDLELNRNGQHILLAKYSNGKIKVPFTTVISTGTGALWLYYYWKKTAFDKASFVFLDEFDAFLHFDASRNILKAIGKDERFQAFLTTHNTLLLDNDLIRPDCAFVIENGSICSLPSTTKRELRYGNNLGKLYVAGEFAH